jgi:hypothetical protein
MHLLAVPIHVVAAPAAAAAAAAAAACQVTDLRAKARLLVQHGATLVGVMDEFGLLQEGQVYVQVTLLLTEVQVVSAMLHKASMHASAYAPVYINHKRRGQSRMCTPLLLSAAVL